MKDSYEKTATIKRHEASGKYFDVDGLSCFALDRGEGEAVLCLHGVPTSSFLYRNIVPELAKRGYRGVAIDFPGLGLSDRPEDFEYSFRALAKFTANAAVKLGLEKYHLVIHDVGGPVGFALAALNQESILSITILNTWIDVVNFTKPWPMRPFESVVLGEIELAMLQHPTWKLMFSQMGVNDISVVPDEEIEAHLDILKLKDGGDAYLKLMRNFDNTASFRDLCYQAVQNVSYPIQAIWGVDDPFLSFDTYGEEIKKVANLATVHKIASRHFLQEEAPLAIVDKIEEIIRASK